ncbi:hypothetical protein BOTBODRAFT_178207 [Botryobasidium botryosum FD-172 SS1]|uniref:Bacterial surface antigen (D15) domain-containing protein n=1 Tax=Botryobasidium botryosum (strain FD-172 SS1) TaxID=930990 RepID=A0A067M6Q2_BOTB1|nr:hypothetical protein BOTBODRAFT_178207 [Botryobasidium botryosum FD-172 SS1]
MQGPENEPSPPQPTLRPPFPNTSSPRDLEPSPDDIDKINKWQQERIERRLRGDYESSVKNLGELINGNLTTPLHISSVRVEGAPRTRHSFLSSLIEPQLSSHNTVETPTLENVLHQVRGISHTLQLTDIFSSVEPTIAKSTAPLSTNKDVDVVFKCRERGRLFIKSSTEVGNGEAGTSFTSRHRNLFGGAETLELSTSVGTKTRRAFHARLTAPVTASLRTQGEIRAFMHSRDNTHYASSKEDVRGVKASVTTTSILGAHELAYEAVLRNIGSLSPTASVSIREAAGTTIKSAVSHTLVRDTRDHPIRGTKGSYLKLFYEFAGLGGDASFLKSESETHISRSLGHGLTLSLATRTGVLYPLNGRPSLYSDRFQLGGPTSVRMFQVNGMGPKDGLDSLGGDVYWAAGLSLMGNLPFKPDWPLKTHLFVNAGRLDSLDTSKPVLPAIKACFAQPSVTAGMGLVFGYDPVRVELNFGVPIVASRFGGWRKGIQIGVGLDFL